MEYTIEEVQHLDDTVSQSVEEPGINSLGEESQPSEDIDLQTFGEPEIISPIQEAQKPGDTDPLIVEDPGYISAVQEDRTPEDADPQTVEDPGYISSMRGEQTPEDTDPLTVEELGYISAEQEEQTPEDTDPLTVEEPGYISAEQEDQTPEDTDLQTVEEPEYISVVQEDQLSVGTNPQPSGEMLSTLAIQEPAVESNTRKIALILSGGGARGAFQVGAEKYARDVKGYHWDIIAGVSVGALNGAMLAMHRYTRLMEIWDTISDGQVYTGGFNLISLARLLFGAKSFYGNAPLQRLMQHEFEAGRVIDDLHVGAVSLISGEYVQFTKESLELAKAILASASIPVVWPPVDVSPDRTAMVDGGVRNITPVGDVLALEPDEVVIINCSPEQPPMMPQAQANVLSIGLRALDIMQNEIFINDMKEFLRINALVQEAEKQDCLLHNPKTGKLLKYYPCQVIEPVGELGGVLDFSQTSIQAALKAGVRRAREVLGRP